MTHSLTANLLRNRHPIRRHLLQQPEIIDIKRRRERIEELPLLIGRIRKRMFRPRGHDNVVPRFCIDGFFQRREADCALRDEECLVVHFVPVLWGPGGVWGDGELDGPDPHVGFAAVFHYPQDVGAHAEGFALVAFDERD